MAKSTLRTGPYKRFNKKIIRYLRKQLPDDTLEEFKKNTPIGGPPPPGNQGGNARSKTKLKIQSKGFEVTGNYPYGGVINEGGYPNPPKAGTGKTSGGFSTQAPKGITKPTIDFVEKEVKQYIRKHS